MGTREASRRSGPGHILKEHANKMKDEKRDGMDCEEWDG